MPVISVFFGIIIRMYYKEHEPVHFHAEHQAQRGCFDLEGKMISGNIQSRTALGLIRQWASLHQPELQANWKRMKGGRPLEGIEPLP